MRKEIKWSRDWERITTSLGTFVTYNHREMNELYNTLRYQKDILHLLTYGNYNMFIDVGAFVGYFSVIAANKCKKVIAYEAHPFYFGLLQYNTKFQFNVDCRYAYIGNENSIPTVGDEFDMVEVFDKNKYNIPVVTLDEELAQFKEENILIKMDIEGGEMNALLGATELLKHDNIHWHIDIHYHSWTEEDIFKFFEGRERIGHIFKGKL